MIDGVPEAQALAETLENRGVPQRVPAQVVYELYVGVGYTDRTDEEVQTLEGVLAARPIVETSGKVAKKAGRLDGQLRRDGERVGVSDLIVGATASSYDEPVVTRNTDDFERLPGIAVRTY